MKLWAILSLVTTELGDPVITLKCSPRNATSKFSQAASGCWAYSRMATEHWPNDSKKHHHSENT